MATPTAAADTAATPLTPLAPEPAARASLDHSDMSTPTAAADTSAAPPPPAPAPPTAAADTTAPPPPAPAPPTAAADTTAPPPPAPAPPTAAADTAAPPPPPAITEPAAKVYHNAFHMAPQTATADTAARPIPPSPAPELAVKVSHFPPPFPPQPDAPAPRRRKLEEAGFHTSAYYKIRATVADLRLRFVQVHEATDFRKSDAAREILREMKTVMELSKKMRLDLSASSEPVKPEKPLAGAMKDGPTEPIPSGERNQVPQTGRPAVPPNIANDGAPSTQA